MKKILQMSVIETFFMFFDIHSLERMREEPTEHKS